MIISESAYNSIVEAIKNSCSTVPNDPAHMIFDPKVFRSTFCRRYFFLFRKNLQNTDISFGELLALLRLHINSDWSPGLLPLQFATSKNLAYSLESLWLSLPDHSTIDGKICFVVDNFHEYLSFTICVDPFFGSCVVHVPKILQLNLKRIVAESGYIYAAGRAIYVRRTTKAKKVKFRQNLLNYLCEECSPGGRKIPFLVHSPQHFPIGKFNTEVASQLRHGLDDVKMPLDKFYFENQPLFDFRVDLSRDPELMKYMAIIDTEHARYEAEPDSTDMSKSIWLIAERQCPQQQSQIPGNRYFACYVQEYVNRNQFHLFNERKPAWISPVTLPHTLAAAMINLARPYLPTRQVAQRYLVILDPFAGTGTTLFEFLKLGIKAKILVNDINPFNKIAIRDNLVFFSATHTYLVNLRKVMLEIAQLLDTPNAEALFQQVLIPRPPSHL